MSGYSLALVWWIGTHVLLLSVYSSDVLLYSSSCLSPAKRRASGSYENIAYDPSGSVHFINDAPQLPPKLNRNKVHKPPKPLQPLTADQTNDPSTSPDGKHNSRSDSNLTPYYSHSTSGLCKENENRIASRGKMLNGQANTTTYSNKTLLQHSPTKAAVSSYRNRYLSNGIANPATSLPLKVNR